MCPRLGVSIPCFTAHGCPRSSSLHNPPISHRHSRTRTNTEKHTQMHTRARTHTHTHSPSLSPRSCEISTSPCSLTEKETEAEGHSKLQRHGTPLSVFRAAAVHCQTTTRLVTPRRCPQMLSHPGPQSEFPSLPRNWHLVLARTSESPLAHTSQSSCLSSTPAPCLLTYCLPALYTSVSPLAHRPPVANASLWLFPDSISAHHLQSQEPLSWPQAHLAPNPS